MNVNNYGFQFYFSTGFNMNAATYVALEFTRPDGTTFTRDSNSTPNAVYVGQVNVEVQSPQTPCGVDPGVSLFVAQEYLGYLITIGDINQVGTWQCRAVYQNSNIPENLTSDITQFEVTV